MPPLSKLPAVMVCDEDPLTVPALRAALRRAGFDVFVVRTAAEALYHARLKAFDAVITEAVLRDGGGVELCRRLRESSDVAVLVLSTVAAEEQKLLAFAAGADDYLTKPFRPLELIARLHAILQRGRRSDDSSPLTVDGLTIDIAGRAVYSDGDRVHLTPTEFELLRWLVKNRGRVVTHMELLQEARGMAHHQDRHTLRVHISHLRRKLAAVGAHSLIHTQPGVGYWFEDSARDRLMRRSSLKKRPVDGARRLAA
jgi:two-component system, OmpR family, KDP operon response regulator KdpE